jgi:hypothetical protein
MIVICHHSTGTSMMNTPPKSMTIAFLALSIFISGLSADLVNAQSSAPEPMSTITPEEQAWLIENPHIKLATLTNQPPFSMIDNERLRSSDVVNLDITSGSRLSVYCTSLGKAILAYLPQVERTRICRRIRFKPFTPYSITEPRHFLNELERTRDRGYAFAVQELSLGLKTMAVPVFDVQDKVVASFGVSYPITRAQDSGFEDRLVEKLIEIKDSC